MALRLAAGAGLADLNADGLADLRALCPVGEMIDVEDPSRQQVKAGFV